MKNTEILLAEITKFPILDVKVFGVFCELMEEQSEEIIKKHFEVVESYITSIISSIEDDDLQTTISAAHPLKSSSQQIGAYRLANIAKNIEDISGSSSPDKSLLKTLGNLSNIAQKNTNTMIVEELEKRKK